MMKTVFTIFLILGIAALTFATTCTNKANDKVFKKLVKDTSVIFLGKAIHIGQSDKISTPVTFQVERSWKGIDTNQITVNFVHDSNVSESILIPKLGASEIFYADRNVTGKVFTSYCQKVDNSQERLNKELVGGTAFEQLLIEPSQSNADSEDWLAKLWKSITSFFS